MFIKSAGNSPFFHRFSAAEVVFKSEGILIGHFKSSLTEAACVIYYAICQKIYVFTRFPHEFCVIFNVIYASSRQYVRVPSPLACVMMMTPFCVMRTPSIHPAYGHIWERGTIMPPIFQPFPKKCPHP